MSKQLEIRVGGAADALERFESMWNRAEEGRPARPLEVLSFADLPLLLKTLTPARWALMQKLRAEGPLSIYELSKRLQRDYKNVHTDVTQLAAIGLIAKQPDARVAVTWDLIDARLG